MFAGHVGAGLAFGRTERSVNVGVFVAAALLLDLLLWTFVLLGFESVTLPADTAHTHVAEFAFPYSHGLVTGLAWSIAAGAAFRLAHARQHAAGRRGAFLVGAAVFSHWVLDALVHPPELPIAGVGSTRIGLGLWQDIPAALAVEAAITAAGLGLYLAGARLSRARKIALAALTLATLALTIAGMTVAPVPPSAAAMAASSLVTLVVVCALFAWLGKPAAAAARGT